MRSLSKGFLALTFDSEKSGGTGVAQAKGDLASIFSSDTRKDQGVHVAGAALARGWQVLAITAPAPFDSSLLCLYQQHCILALQNIQLPGQPVHNGP